MNAKQIDSKIKDCQQEIKELEKEISKLRNMKVTMDDIVPFAVFNIIGCDMLVLVPNIVSGGFMMGGLNHDFKQFWTDSDGDISKRVFSQKKMLEKIVSLNGTKSDKEIILSKKEEK